MNHKLTIRTLIAAFLWVIVMLILTPVCISSSQTRVYVAPSAITVTVGQKFSVSIEISDVTDLYAWEFKLKWNPAFLNALRITEGDFLKSGGNTFFWQIINNSRGCSLATCTLYGNIPGVNGSGTLAIIEFEVKSAGESILDLYDTKLVNSLEQSINHTCEDGYATTNKPVGGVWVPINKLELFTPLIVLATVSLIVTAVTFIKRRRKTSPC